MTFQPLVAQKRPRKMTKKARKEAVRAIIDRNSHGVAFDGDDVANFRDLIDRDDIAGVMRVENPTFPGDPRFIRVDHGDGQWVPFSWNKAIDGWVADSPPIVMRAMRHAIRDQMREFREEGFNDLVPAECETCGALDDLTVDHVNPPFSAIVKQFTSEYGVPALKEGRDGEGRVIANADVEASWAAFHAHHADFQILCRSCNASKGARIK